MRVEMVTGGACCWELEGEGDGCGEGLESEATEFAMV